MPASLSDRFKAAIKCFNDCTDNIYTGLADYLDPGIMMKRVDDPSWVSGIGNVMTYLISTQAALKPWLDYSNYTEYPSSSNSSVHGVISGSAGMYYDSSGANPYSVHYSFTFKRKTTSEEWRIAIAYAARNP